MRAAVLHAVKDLRTENAANPIMKPGEVLLRIRASGICGSDIPRVFQKGTYHFPTIPGHEFSGEIVDAFDSEQKELIGRKASVFPLLPCFECRSCEVGEYAQCENYNYFGSRCDGGFAEYISVPLWNVVLLPDDINLEEAAMCEPAAVALHAVGKASLHVGDTVVIYGAGTIGLIAAMWCEINGAGRVILADIDGKKLEFAAKLGFSDTFNSIEEDIPKRVNELTGNRGADACIDCAGVASAVEGCLNAVKNGGRVVAMGNPAGDMLLHQKDYWQILRKELTLAGTWNSSYNAAKNDWRNVVQAIAGHKLSLKPLITHRFGLEQAKEAFDLFKNRNELAVKVMFIND